MFLLKKIVAPLLFPVSLCIEILFVGLVLLWFTRKQRAGKVLVSLGTALLLALSYGSVCDILLKPLEYRYPPLLGVGEEDKEVKWVVVLGHGHKSDPTLPITSRLSKGSIARVAEGIRIHRMLPDSRLILSGSGVYDPVSNARLMADLAVSLGVDRERIILEEKSRDTEEEAEFIKGLVGKERFILVTSASHMPRSMVLFKKAGTHPIPAPAGHLVKERQGMSPAMFFPWADNLKKAERAVYEYLGILWAKLRGKG